MQTQRRTQGAATPSRSGPALGRHAAPPADSPARTARTISALTLVIAALGTGAAVSSGSGPGHPIAPHSRHAHSVASTPGPVRKPPWMF